jgi:hypothetical protein
LESPNDRFGKSTVVVKLLCVFYIVSVVDHSDGGRK